MEGKEDLTTGGEPTTKDGEQEKPPTKLSVKVFIHSAKKMPAFGMLKSASNPYVIVRFNGKEQKTLRLRKAVTAQWDQRLDFQLPKKHDLKDLPLILEVTALLSDPEMVTLIPLS